MIQPLCVKADLDSLELVGAYVVEATKLAKLNAKRGYKLRLAADEIATNIITHGYLEAGLEGELDIQVELNAQSLRLIFEDSAIPYDPRQAPLPNLDLPLEERPIGGLGVFLTLDGVDEFYYERVNSRNRTTLVVLFHS